MTHADQNLMFSCPTVNPVLEDVSLIEAAPLTFQIYNLYLLDKFHRIKTWRILKLNPLIQTSPTILAFL